jgi:hypothetical protein
VNSGLTEAQVRLQFSKEEDADVARGVPSLHDVSPSAFITAGLDLEDEQYVPFSFSPAEIRAVD